MGNQQSAMEGSDRNPTRKRGISLATPTASPEPPTKKRKTDAAAATDTTSTQALVYSNPDGSLDPSSDPLSVVLDHLSEKYPPAERRRILMGFILDDFRDNTADEILDVLAKDIEALDLESPPHTVLTSAPRTPSRERTLTSLRFLEDLQQATEAFRKLDFNPVNKSGAGGSVQLMNGSAKPFSSIERESSMSPAASWQESGGEGTDDVTDSETDIDDDMFYEEEDLPDEDVGT